MRTNNTRSTLPSPASESLQSAKRLVMQRGDGISTRRGFIPVRLLRPLVDGDMRICALTERCQGYPAETLFLYDRSLEKEKGLTHKAYTQGLYWMLRGILYALEGYGVGAPAQGGEFGRLKEDEKRILKCAERLLDGDLSRKDQETVLDAVRAIQNSLIAATDSAKQQAHANAGRGMQLTDRRGRRNVPAATLSLGGVACQLKKRTARIVHIAQVYRQHARIVSEVLDAHIVVVLRLWGALQEKPDLERWGFLQHVDIASLGDNRMATNQRLMQELREMFQKVNPFAPFHNEWAEIMLWLREAEEAAACDDAHRFGRIKGYLHRRTEWTLLRHALELNIIARLGIILRRLERKEQDKLRRKFPRIPVGVRDLRFHREQDPKGFEDVWVALQFFLDKMRLASDREFPVKFQRQFLDRLKQAQVHMSREEWRTAREVLKSAAALI